MACPFVLKFLSIVLAFIAIWLTGVPTTPIFAAATGAYTMLGYAAATSVSGIYVIIAALSLVINILVLGLLMAASGNKNQASDGCPIIYIAESKTEVFHYAKSCLEARGAKRVLQLRLCKHCKGSPQMTTAEGSTD